MPEYLLYAWGANSHGQLGLGFANEQEFEPRLVDFEAAETLTKVVGGAGHTLLLDEHGKVYVCGWNEKGPIEPSALNFRELPFQDRIVDVACGWDSSMALTQDGRVFVWGSNSHGQLGSRSLALGARTSEPLQLELDVPISKISLGLRHSALVTRDGRVLVSGAASKGQLGLLPGELTNKFLEGIQNARDVSCGQYYTLIIARDNAVLAWGDNKHGQLGVDPMERKAACSPFEIALSTTDIETIHCGWTHTLLRTLTGEVYSWGRNTYGQLGRGKTKPNESTWDAQEVDVLERIERLSVGSEHNLALTEGGWILSWGWNEHGNCGNGDTADVPLPSRVLLRGEGKLIGTGAGHSFAVMRRED